MFFPSWKTIFKQSRHLLDTWLSVELLRSFLSQSRQILDSWWIERESSWILDSFSTPGGSIEPHLLCLMFLYLDTFSTLVSVDGKILDTWLDTLLDTSRHLYLSRITEALYIGLSWSGSHLLNLSRSIRSYSPPKHFLLPLNVQPMWFSAFPCFKSLGMCSFSFILHAFHAFRPRFWGFFENFWGFSKLMSYCYNFGMGLWLNEFKILCIASH